jgi:hypothetical protein
VRTENTPACAEARDPTAQGRGARRTARVAFTDCLDRAVKRTCVPVRRPAVWLRRMNTELFMTRSSRGSATRATVAPALPPCCAPVHLTGAEGAPPMGPNRRSILTRVMMKEEGTAPLSGFHGAGSAACIPERERWYLSISDSWKYRDWRGHEGSGRPSVDGYPIHVACPAARSRSLGHARGPPDLVHTTLLGAN